MRKCSPQAAHWCGNCGKCTCIRVDQRGHRDWDSKVHDDCPLHGIGVRHPTAHIKFIPRRKVR